MTLLVSLKESAQRNGRSLSDAFRQVENWANAIKWQAPSLAANWANFGSGTVNMAFMMDPFGLVHIRGTPAYTGTIAASAAVTLFTLPPSFAPIQDSRFPIMGASSGVASNSLIRLLVTHLGVVEVENVTTGTLTNPIFHIGSLLFQAGF